MLCRPGTGLGRGGVFETKRNEKELKMNEERMLKLFEYKHLPQNLQEVSQAFCFLAESMAQRIEPGPERTVALRKLLEAKDAAVRATVHPGG
jgi:hypothetical protein